VAAAAPVSALRVLDAPRADDLGDAPEAWLARLGGPALLRLPGRDRTRTRALTTLLHGNEPSGLRALHRWLRARRTPAVDGVVFVGAVAAALAPPGFAHRMLPGRPDLNRCFAPSADGPEGELARELVGALRAARPEALLDVHNNTGHNPAYAVATRVDRARLALTGLFAERFVHSDLRLGTLTEATEDLCPGIAAECGRAGDPAADEVAFGLIDRFLGAEHLPERPERPLVVLHQPVRIRLAPGARVAFAEGPVAGADLTVAGDVDRHNFETLAAGTPVGWVRDADGWPLEAHGADGAEVSRELFTLRDLRLETRRELVPMMMTTDAVVAAADCLFYAVSPRNVEED
jgi:hypothetical protein